MQYDKKLELGAFLKEHSFNFYGRLGMSMSMPLDELIAQLPDDGESFLFARAEHSGSEGCYCEVARVDIRTGIPKRFSRYCFAKFFGGEVGDELPDSYATANFIAVKINSFYGGDTDGFIHFMENWIE